MKQTLVKLGFLSCAASLLACNATVNSNVTPSSNPSSNPSAKPSASPVASGTPGPTAAPAGPAIDTPWGFSLKATAPEPMKNLLREYLSKSKDPKAVTTLLMRALYYVSVESDDAVALQYLTIFTGPEDDTPKSWGDTSKTLTGRAIWENSDLYKIAYMTYRSKPELPRSYFVGTRMADDWKLPADVNTLGLQFPEEPHIDDPKCTNCGPGTAFVLIQNQDTRSHAFPDSVVLKKRADGSYYARDLTKINIAPITSKSPDFVPGG